MDKSQYLAQTQQNTLTQKCDSLSDIGHDLNNVMTVILGNMRLLTSLAEKDSHLTAMQDVLKKLHPVLRAADKGKTLAQRLMVFADENGLAKSSMVYQSVAECCTILQKGGFSQIETKLADQIWPVGIDAAQLKDTLVSLAQSNRTFALKNQKLTIEAENIVLDRDYALFYFHAHPGSYVMITISIMGGQQRDRFLQYITYPIRLGLTKPESGLASIHETIRSQNGYIHIYSEKNYGSVFRLYLPSLHHDEPAVEQEKHEDRPLSRGQEYILIVEDEPDTAMMAHDMLTELGYRTFVAKDMTNALQIIENTEIDMVFTDMVLSNRMTGVDLAKRIARKKPRMKFLFTSGFTSANIPLSKDVNQNNFIAKPYHKHDLAHRIRAVLYDEQEDRHEQKTFNSRY